MEQLKIKVNNEAESKEAQELFFELGFKRPKWADSKYDTEFLITYEDGDLLCSDIDSSKKEITLPELRDMVVLKRNDPKDANYYRGDGKEYFVNSDKTRSYYMMDDEWTLTKWDEAQLQPQLKPIEKTEMKEKEQAKFLVKTDGGYILKVLDIDTIGEDIIRIPDGAGCLTSLEDYLIFWKDGFKKCIGLDDDWVKSNHIPQDYIDEYSKAKIVWQHSSIDYYNPNHKKEWTQKVLSKVPNDLLLDGNTMVDEFKQPEDLPFLDNGIDADVENLPEFKPEFPTEKEIKTDFPLNRGDINYRVAKAFNEIRGTDLTEDDLDYLRKLIDLTISHYTDRF